MTYRGRIEHGVIVLDLRLSLPEGTQVEVVPLSGEVSSAVGQSLEKLAGKALGLPSDLAEWHDHYRRERGT